MDENKLNYNYNNYNYNNNNNNNYDVTYNNQLEKTHTYTPFIGLFFLLFLSFLLACMTNNDNNNNNNNNLNINLLKNNLPIIKIKNANNEICTICLENFLINDKINILGCNHIFHKECLDNWFINNNCPLCRKIII